MIRKLERGEPTAALLASWKYVLLGLVVGMALGALYYHLKPVLYETDGIVAVIQPKMGNGEFSLRDTMLQQESFLPFFSAHSLLEETRRRFDLGKDYPPHVLKNRIKVEPVRKSNLLRIQLTFEDAERAELIARFIIDEGVKKHEALRAREQEQSTSVLRDQLQRSRDLIDTTETELIDLVTKNRLPVLNKQLEALQELIVELETEVQLNALELEQLSAKANSIEAALEEQDTVFLTRSVLADEDDLRHGIARQGGVSDSELADMEVSREVLNDAYVKGLEEQTTTLADLQGLRARQAIAQKKLNDTLKRTDELVNLVWPMNAEEERLTKKLETALEVMEEAREQYERVATLVSQRSQSMELLEPPFVPNNPTGPGLLVLIAVGGIAGFGGALTLILLASRSGDLLSLLKSSDSPDHRESERAGD